MKHFHLRDVVNIVDLQMFYICGFLLRHIFEHKVVKFFEVSFY